MQVSTIGIDLNVFQVHGVDAHGKVVLVRQLRRKQVLLLRHAPRLSRRHGGMRDGASLGA
jgi:hypothetical protein